MPHLEDHNTVSLDERSYLDLYREALVRDGMLIHFSRIQFRILNRLVQNLGNPVSNEEIIRAVWGVDGIDSKNELYVYVNRIRKQLEDNPQKPRFLVSIRGYGYVLLPQRKVMNG